jgi:hypothetical protein
MLAYLDMLCAALMARDPEGIMRLLEHPLAAALPDKVRDEALAVVRAGPGGRVAPVKALHMYHQTAHLLGVRSDPATRKAPPPPPSRRAASGW